MFFKHFASKYQLPGFYTSETLVEDGLNDLSQMFNVPTRTPNCDSHRYALCIYFFLLTLVFVLQWLSHHLVISVSLEFPVNSKQDALFHRTAYDYSCADWDGLLDHLRYVPWEDTFKLSTLLLVVVNFAGGFSLELMYISLIVGIRSNLTQRYGFHQLVLLP